MARPPSRRSATVLVSKKNSVKRFQHTPRAAEDLNEIWDYIAGENIAAADRVLDALERMMVRLAQDPEIGHGVRISPTSAIALSPSIPI